jgi:hypothetical protein
LVERKVWEKAEYEKLGSDAGLWQLIQHTHAYNADVQNACRSRIAARPNLEGEMSALLETGWAEHALAYLRDAYPLPLRNLSPAYAKFLDKELGSWRIRLTNDEHAGKWEQNMHPLFDVAEKIAEDGGDLRPQLEAWRSMLQQAKGMGMVIRHVDAALKRHSGRAR